LNGSCTPHDIDVEDEFVELSEIVKSDVQMPEQLRRRCRTASDCRLATGGVVQTVRIRGRLDIH
jgi:hypothetical protein